MRCMGGHDDSQRSNQQNDIVVRLFAACTCLPPYCAVVPGLCMIWCIMTDGNTRRRMWSVPFVKSLTGFVAVLLLSTLRYGDAKSMLTCAGVSAAMVVMVYLRAVITRKGIRFFLNIAMMGSIANAVIATVQALVFDTAGGYRATGLFYNPNYFAMMSGFVLVLALYLWFSRMSNKLLIIAAITGAFVGLVLSNSRTGLFCALFGALLLILWMKTRRGALYFALSFGAITAVLICFPQLLRLDELGTSFGTRTELWHIAMEGIKQRPLLGQGAWSFVRIAHGTAPMGEIHAHNLLLELILSSGILGTALLGLYLFGNLRGLVRVRRREQDAGLSSAALVLFCMVLLHGLFDVTVFAPQNAVALMLMLAVAGLVKEQRTDKK